MPDNILDAPVAKKRRIIKNTVTPLYVFNHNNVDNLAASTFPPTTIFKNRLESIQISTTTPVDS